MGPRSSGEKPLAHRTHWLVLILGGGILILSGCGCGPAAASLSGNVTYEGKPLQRGAIELAPEDGEGPIIGSPILSGQYKIAKFKPGKYRVTIATERVPLEAAPPGGGYPAEYFNRSMNLSRKDLMPAEVGQNLTVTANPGENTQDFPLKRPAK